MTTHHHRLTRVGIGLAIGTALIAVPAAASGLAGGSTDTSAAKTAAVADHSPNSSKSSTKTTHERGFVLECRGKTKGLRVSATLYENNVYGNDIQIALGGPDGEVNGRALKRKLVEKGHLTRAAKVMFDGKPAKVRGTAYKVGPKTPVHDEYDDAGNHIIVDGTHRRMITDMGLIYDGKRVGLTCDAAFAYNLTVVTESVE